MYILKIKQFLLLSVLILFSVQIEAKDNFFNWSNLSQEQYISKLVDCEYKLQEHKWSKNIWPEQNKNPKPTFSESVEIEKIRQQVLETLIMQSILADRFNIIITNKMLQQDLDRMANSTKNANELKSLFALFDNNPNTVAQCISRPYLVRQKTQNNFNYNSEIHSDTKLLAHLELQEYLTANKSKPLNAEINTTTFEIEQESQDKSKTQMETGRQTIKLSKEEFIVIVEQLQNNSLIEKDQSFIFSEIEEIDDSHIKIKTLNWKKTSFNQWLKSQSATIYQPENINWSLKLPKVTVSNATGQTTLKAGTVGNTWETKPSRVDGRYLHTAIWTGTEMIIWGGEQFSKLNTGGRYDPATDSWRSTSIGVNVPSARIEHSVVWTGTEMIVWGGDTGSVLTNSGGRYDPLTDSWQPTSRGANVPSNRNVHTAVWSGTEMIIWGGNTNPLNSGGRYNPTTNSWQATSIDNNTPNERLFHKAIWADTKMIVWGGFISGNYFNTGGIYDPVTDSWEATSIGANVPGGRMNHTVIWTGSEMIVWGGFNGAYRNSGARLDPVTNSWLPTSLGTNVPVVRGNHTATWTGNEMVVWGGINGSSSLDTGGRYDPVNDSWLVTSMTNAPGVRSEHTAVWTGNEVIVWGGHVGNTDFNTGGRYNPVADSWQSTSIGDFPTGRYRHSAIWTGTEMIIWGGVDLSTAFNTGGRYNPATNSWHSTSLAANVPGGRYGHTAVWTGTQMIVWGGENTNNELKSGGRYNPANDSWLPTSTGANSPAARTDHSMVWTGNEVIVWGGYTSTCCSSQINTGGRYDPDSDSWQVTSTGANAPSPREAHTAIWTGDEMIIWGGFQGSNYLNTGNRYNPDSDSWLPTSTTTAARASHTAIWTGSEMIVWGGGDTTDILRTGSRYNPVADTWQSTIIDANTPPKRYLHSAIWTGSEMIVWGGSGAFPDLDTGGRYNPMTDSWLATQENIPLRRNSHTAIWTGKEMIVWGGIGVSSLPNSVEFYYPYSTYVIGGTLSGLNGDQVILQNNNNDDLTLTTNGDFEFDTAIAEGLDYEVTVLSDPQNPAQTCTVSMGSGVNTMADVGNVEVDCVNDFFNVGVTVNGLAPGNSVFLENNGGDFLEVSNNNSLTNFSTQVSNGLDYLITFNTQPTSPNQVCSIAEGEETGTINAADVNVAVTCINLFSIGVTVTGLDINNSIELTANLQSLVFNNNGAMSFPSQLNDGTNYAVMLTAQPTDPNQECTITGGNSGNNDGSGTLAGANAQIAVNCIYIYRISGMLTGLNGNQVIIQNNGGDDLNLTANGDFSFSTSLPEGTDYAVTVLSDPQNPAQTCTVSMGSGVNIMADVGNVEVDCVNDFYNVGVTVNGLAPGNSVFLENNGGDLLEVSSNNSLTNFSTQVGNGLDYLITFNTQPTSPNQECSILVGDETGTVNAADVNIAVTCVVTQYDVSVTVSGLDSNNSIELTTNLQSLVFNNNGAMSFPNPLNDGTNYAVMLTAQPTDPNQECTITGGNSGNNDGSGTLAGANAQITVNCIYIYRISGMLTGLNGDQVIIQNNGGDDLNLTANGDFAFSTSLPEGTDYAVTVLSDPQNPAQTCTVSMGSGVNIMADVGNVEVDCVNDFFNVGVTVNGLAPGNSVFLENNGGDLLEVSSNNSLTNFSIQVGNGLEYLVTFFSQPTTPNQTCQFTTPSTGTINGTDAAVIQVECVTESYFIGGTVSGLLDGNYMVIQNNKGDDEIIMSNGAYLFSTPLFDEENYNVQIFMQPVNPIQPCIVDNNSSNLAGFDVDDVDINCEIGNDFIFRNGFEGLPLTF